MQKTEINGGWYSPNSNFQNNVKVNNVKVVLHSKNTVAHFAKSEIVPSDHGLVTYSSRPLFRHCDVTAMDDSGFQNKC